VGTMNEVAGFLPTGNPGMPFNPDKEISAL
jgi:hypothetical protein